MKIQGPWSSAASQMVHKGGQVYEEAKAPSFARDGWWPLTIKNWPRNGLGKPAERWPPAGLTFTHICSDSRADECQIRSDACHRQAAVRGGLSRLNNSRLQWESPQGRQWLTEWHVGWQGCKLRKAAVQHMLCRASEHQCRPSVHSISASV